MGWNSTLLPYLIIMGSMPNSTNGNQVKCPKCGSTSIYADKKGFGGGKACCGALLAGPLGLLCGTFKQNKIKITCLNCKYTWS